MTDARARHGQLVVDSEVGDCFRASMSYILGIPNSDLLPNEHAHQIPVWREWLGRFGLSLRWDHTACWSEGLWIASVLSKNIPDRTHAIVMSDLKVEFDPSPRRRYHVGWNLLGKDVVLGGYQIIVRDPRATGIRFAP